MSKTKERLMKTAVTENLYKDIRILAAVEDRSIKSIIEEALNEWIDNHKKRRFLPKRK